MSVCHVRVCHDTELVLDATQEDVPVLYVSLMHMQTWCNMCVCVIIQTWCSVQRKKTARLALEDDVHAPDR